MRLHNCWSCTLLESGGARIWMARWLCVRCFPSFTHNSIELALLSQPQNRKGQKIHEIAFACVCVYVMERFAVEHQLHQAIHHQFWYLGGGPRSHKTCPPRSVAMPPRHWHPRLLLQTCHHHGPTKAGAISQDPDGQLQLGSTQTLQSLHCISRSHIGNNDFRTTDHLESEIGRRLCN